MRVHALHKSQHSKIMQKTNAKSVDDVTFARECRRWKAKWQISSPEPFKPLESALTPATENSYPNVRISTATAERSFSTMRRYHGNRAHIDLEEVVDVFARRK
ncbi:hypothetical protein DPMN_166727 [Dreissena polymorpha]|uniref:Uncharacterized protein n=1 Tax=Dreissena polymorpha TaxID=45954 RepID=A0A9D4F333_DREPO|nr:hypothetical protein DPMN_166727 [Dreissena polymorpha]